MKRLLFIALLTPGILLGAQQKSGERLTATVVLLEENRKPETLKAEALLNAALAKNADLQKVDGAQKPDFGIRVINLTITSQGAFHGVQIMTLVYLLKDPDLKIPIMGKAFGASTDSKTVEADAAEDAITALASFSKINHARLLSMRKGK
jgi:hypothetical protein